MGGLIEYYNSMILVAMKDLLLQVRCGSGGGEGSRGVGGGEGEMGGVD